MYKYHIIFNIMKYIRYVKIYFIYVHYNNIIWRDEIESNLHVDNDYEYDTHESFAMTFTNFTTRNFEKCKTAYGTLSYAKRTHCIRRSKELHYMVETIVRARQREKFVFIAFSFIDIFHLANVSIFQIVSRITVGLSRASMSVQSALKRRVKGM